MQWSLSRIISVSVRLSVRDLICQWFFIVNMFQVSSFKFYLSHTRLYRDCITSSEMRVGSAPWTVQILKKQHKGSKHKIR